MKQALCAGAYLAVLLLTVSAPSRAAVIEAWVQRYHAPGGRNEEALAVAADSAGNVIVTGMALGTNGSTAYTAKYAAADGALLWEKRTSGGEQAVTVDGRGDVVVAGTGFDGTNNGYYTAKYAGGDGKLIWEQTYGGPPGSYGFATAVAVDAEGNALVTGRSGPDC